MIQNETSTKQEHSLIWRKLTTFFKKFVPLLRTQTSRPDDEEPVGDQPGTWAVPSDEENEHLSELLPFAAGNYGQHLDWFQRHRDVGIKNLGLIIAAESGVIGFFLSREGPVQEHLVGPVCILLSCLSILAAPILGISAIASCRNAFHASLDAAMLLSKVIFAMGLHSKVKVCRSNVDMDHCPGADDYYLYPPYHVKTTCEAKTSKQYYEARARLSTTTFYWANVTLRLFTLGAVVLGILGILWIVVSFLGHNHSPIGGIKSPTP